LIDIKLIKYREDKPSVEPNKWELIPGNGILNVKNVVYFNVVTYISNWLEFKCLPGSGFK